MSSLKVDYCSKKAARWACENWHYSRKISKFRGVQFGVWEHDKFIGAVVFGNGANSQIGSPFGLPNIQVCELTRVALTRHEAPVTRILKICIAMLKKKCPKLRLIISYADTAQGHDGGIYRGGNWYYLGLSKAKKLQVRGRLTHPKTFDSRYKQQNVKFFRDNIDPNARWFPMAGKHKFAYPLDKKLRPMLTTLEKPFASEVLTAT